MSELGEEIVSQYVSSVQRDKQIAKIVKKIRNGGDYGDAEQYAIRSGEILSEVFHKNITADTFPVGSVDEIAQMIIPAIKMNYEANSQAVSLVQKSLNRSGGIGMNAIPTKYDDSAAMNIAGRMAKYETFEDAEWMFDEPMVTNSIGAVDNALHENADFQYKSGLKPKIIRTCESDACEWCQMLEGEYDYEEVRDRGNPVYQRHNNCACEITYEPGDGRSQDVSSKQWYDEGEKANRLAFAKNLSRQSANQNIADLRTRKIIASGSTDHIRQRQRKNERNISDQAINSVIKHPINQPEKTIEYDDMGRPSVKYIGEKITVIVNPDTGDKITVRRTTKRERERWKKKN